MEVEEEVQVQSQLVWEIQEEEGGSTQMMSHQRKRAPKRVQKKVPTSPRANCQQRNLRVEVVEEMQKFREIRYWLSLCGSENLGRKKRI